MAEKNVSDYLKDVVAKGDQGSELLQAITAPSLLNQPNAPVRVRVLQSGMNGLVTLDEIPEDFSIVVHSAGGDPRKRNLNEYSKSLVENLIKTTPPNATPIGITNVVDSNLGEKEMLETIGSALLKQANKHSLPILNGENAILGDRVSVPANLSGTMISISRSPIFKDEGTLRSNGIEYSFFQHEGKPVLANCDGVGTKTDFYERRSESLSEDSYYLANRDFIAMNADDASKVGATIKAISGVLEFSGNISTSDIQNDLSNIATLQGFFGSLQPEDLGSRISGFRKGVPTYNISGTVVSLIDEDRLENPLAPKEGDCLIAIRSTSPNPRSNGITGRRKLMTSMFGEDWHLEEDYRDYLDFLTAPSTIFYSTFKELTDSGLATSVYHMSGGAFNGKLAKPLAKHGLGADIGTLFSMSSIEERLFKLSGVTPQEAYEMWPMGNEAFITSKPENVSLALFLLQERGYKAIPVALLESNPGISIATPYGEVSYLR